MEKDQRGQERNEYQPSGHFGRVANRKDHSKLRQRNASVPIGGWGSDRFCARLVDEGGGGGEGARVVRPLMAPSSSRQVSPQSSDIRIATGMILSRVNFSRDVSFAGTYLFKGRDRGRNLLLFCNFIGLSMIKI